MSPRQATDDWTNLTRTTGTMPVLRGHLLPCGRSRIGARMLPGLAAGDVVRLRVPVLSDGADRCATDRRRTASASARAAATSARPSGRITVRPGVAPSSSAVPHIHPVVTHPSGAAEVCLNSTKPRSGVGAPAGAIRTSPIPHRQRSSGPNGNCNRRRGRQVQHVAVPAAGQVGQEERPAAGGWSLVTAVAAEATVVDLAAHRTDAQDSSPTSSPFGAGFDPVEVRKTLDLWDLYCTLTPAPRRYTSPGGTA